MEKSSDGQDEWRAQREKIIGLGERSLRKTYYPELQQKLDELERFRALLDQSNDCIFLIQATALTLIDVNESACLQLGWPREELLGRPLADLLPAQVLDRVSSLVAGAQGGGEDGDLVSTQLVRASGEEFPVEITLHLVNFNKELYGVAVARDITERKRAEAENQKLEEQLVQAMKMESVGRLAGGVAHDFNNMLFVILGNAELALANLGPAHPLYTNLEGIRQAAERSAVLTRQLLAFARKQPITPKVLDLNSTVDSMLMMLRRLVGEDIELSWTPCPDLWQARIDPSQIDQILMNLTANARDAIAGVGKVSIRTGNVKADQAYCAAYVGFVPGDYVLLAVSDNGRGMDKETQAKIFEPFFTTKESGKGTGLGLATVYGIVQQNHGVINVYSEKGGGTTFNVYLPRYLGDETGDAAETRTESAQGGSETVLLVEDEPLLLEMTRTMLESLGYTVLAAGRPSEAIALAAEHAGGIDLLMTDVVMPEMNGRDLAKALLAPCPHLKHLFMSGYAADIVAHHGILEAGIHFIQKPFPMRDLAAKVREVLDT